MWEGEPDINETPKHPHISSLSAEHLWSPPQAAALAMPAGQLPAEDSKVPDATDAHTADHFQWSLLSETHSTCYLPTEHVYFRG